MVMALAGNKADLEDRRSVQAEVSIISVLFLLAFTCLCIPCRSLGKWLC